MIAAISVYEARVENEEPRASVWTFTGLCKVRMGGQDQIDLGGGFLLSRPTPRLLSVRSRQDLSGKQFDEIGALDCFLVHREVLPMVRGRERDKKIERFQDGLIALQVLKPIKTLGIIFQASEAGSDRLNLETGCTRPPMDPWEWATMRPFDEEFISETPRTITKVAEVKSRTAAEPKNALSLLQLALEHLHPLVAGLLSVMGIEAVLSSEGRNDFRHKLCECLGESTRIFPDWNSPTHSPPGYTVGQIAVDLFMLRNMIAHGIDLKRALHDKKDPVDLLKKVQVGQSLHDRAYCLLLSEAALYLLCAVIKKKLLA